jgi:hypothetical protein
MRTDCFGAHRVIFIDLDSVIVGDISKLLALSRPKRLLTLSAKHMNNELGKLSPNVANTSVMVWNSGPSWNLISELATDRVRKFVHRFDHWIEYAAENITDFVPDDLVVDYLVWKEKNTVLSNQTVIITFPGSLKPHECMKNCSLIASHWKF